MANPKCTRQMAQWYAVAVMLNIPNPLGVAAYITNRCHNGAMYGRSFYQTMLRCKASTAARWLAHWQAGGSLKALGYTHNGWLLQRQVNQLRALACTLRVLRQQQQQYNATGWPQVNW